MTNKELEEKISILSQKVEKIVAHNDYLVENLEQQVQYTEYLAENLRSVMGYAQFTNENYVRLTIGEYDEFMTLSEEEQEIKLREVKIDEFID